MSTHFKDYDSVEGRHTACGRYFANDVAIGRGIVITPNVSGVSCMACIQSKRFRLAKARVSRPLDAPLRREV